MRVLLYEYVTGGGQWELERRKLPTESLLREGRAMVAAVAEDLARIPGMRLVTLHDRRLEPMALPDCELHQVREQGQDRTCLARLTSQCDWTIVIAPEFDELLLDRCQLVERAGGRLLGPSGQPVAWASDKHETSRRWQAAGVPTPRSCLLRQSQAPPSDWMFPAVLKPRDGAGCLAVQRVDQASELPQAWWPSTTMRLEQYCPGLPASVAVLGGGGGKPIILPPCRQILSGDERYGYQGGQLLASPDLRRRAKRLGAQAASILGPFVGYVGIDLILGLQPQRPTDMAIEINPRITTSYIGLRHAVHENLAHIMLQLAQGTTAQVTLKSLDVRFDAQGRVTGPRH